MIPTTTSTREATMTDERAMYGDGKYDHWDDEAPAPRATGKEGRRQGSLTDLAVFGIAAGNGARKRAAAGAR